MIDSVKGLIMVKKTTDKEDLWEFSTGLPKVLKKRLHLHRKAQNSLDTIMWEVSTC